MRKQVMMVETPPETPPELPPGRGDGETILQTRPKSKKPDMFKVLLINDDYTPMEFVIYVLEALFNKKREEATQIMLAVHNHGVGVCGIYPYEIAETKAAQLLQVAKVNEHPLQCRVEKE